jgi:hypothetical protein
MSIAAPAGARFAPAVNEPVRKQVHGLLSPSANEQLYRDRRSDRRHPFPALMTLFAAEGENDAAPQVIVGKDLSERGMGFFHPRPIYFRNGVVVCDTPDGGQVAFLIDISWCRFTRHGWYESGCRLLEVVPPPAITHTTS